MIVSTSQIKLIDRFAIDQLGIPSLTLMERAAQHVTDAVLELLEEKSDNVSRIPRVVVICGYGNNGGDGLACARQLRKAGIIVSTILVGDPSRITPDAAVNKQRLLDAGGQILEISSPEAAFPKESLSGADCLVDSLFGVGLSRKVEGIYEKTIQALLETEIPVICVDIPSGLHGDTGEVMGCCVRALQTITFTALKPGLLTGEGPEYAGTVKVGDIGIPMEKVPIESL